MSGRAMTNRAILVGGLCASVGVAWASHEVREAVAATQRSPSPSPTPGGSPAPPTYVGSTVCAQCHFNRFESYQNSPHSFKGDPKTPVSRFECEICHGAGSAHVQGGGGRGVGGLRNFGATMPPGARFAGETALHGQAPP